MPSTSSLSRSGRIYVGCVTAAGAAAIIYSAYDLLRNPIDWHWFVLAGLTLLSGSITVKLPSIPATISVSETFVFIAVILFGTSAGTITVTLDAFIISVWLTRKKKLELHKALFNVAAPSLSLWCSARLYFFFSGTAPLSMPNAYTKISDLFGPLIAFSLAYFLLNSVLIALAIAAEKRVSAFGVWRENFSWLSLNFFSGASVAVLFVAYTREVSASAVAIIIPILVISYLTYKTSMGRLEDTTKHLSELNLLYLSTIETLAMWIDAKDQITHGHIRRVQIYAVELARELGVKDDKLIKAIEAAALLHDMGKLAVPEHILNKPGKLTPGEFEKMKLHASVGAQILSAIEFPYPVVPIVRHHHENWDGSGYPDGLAGMDIPIGARILSVVDCFDALTSDRPYRPKLADEEALRMLTLRRGSMYDPLVVDSFLRVHRKVDPDAQGKQGAGRDRSEAVWESVRSESSGMFRAPAPPAAPDPAASLDLSGEIGMTLARLGKQVIPVSLSVLFVPDDSSDSLAVAHAVGEPIDCTTGLRIGLGHGVSGWVASNKRPIANSEAFLDLGEAASAGERALRSCLSVPVQLGDTMIAVLSLYSTEPNHFTQHHCDTLEATAKSFVEELGSRSRTIERSEYPEPAISSVAELDLLHGEVFGPQLGLICLRVDSAQSLSESEFSFFTTEIDRTVRDNLRAGDISVRCGSLEWAILLSQADRAITRATAGRIAAAVDTIGVLNQSGPFAGVTAQWGVAISPEDGASFDALSRAARSRIWDTNRGQDEHSVGVH